MYLKIFKHAILASLLISLIPPIHAQITYQNAFPNLSFSFPVEIQNTGVPGDDRLFIVEQQGRIKVFDNNANAASSTTFLDITSQVNYNVGQEKGLLGLAFHPDYEQNGYFYVYMTGLSGGLVEIIVKRFQVSAGNPNVASVASGCEVIAFVKNQSNSNHNGGKITFGPDGYLYASVGDGGGAGDPQNNGQNNNNLFGAILRLDVNTSCPGYAIPPDNPFVGTSGADEIFAWGIRNTWKMNFDFATNLLWGGDVGQNQYEEINLIENGGNYGWKRYEGNVVYSASAPTPANPIFPIYVYSQSQGDRSITGGYVYRGSQISSTNPDIYGKYVFADYVTGRVWYLDYDPSTGSATRTLLFNAVDQGGARIYLSTFGEDINQELYFADYLNGDIYQLVDGFTAPSAVAVNGVGNWCAPISTSTDGTVNASIADGNGNIYVGGSFNTVGGISAQNIALWNGSTWTTLSTGANGTIYALALTSNGDLYAGGNFTQIGGINANNIARWNGSTWQALGSGTDGPVLAISVNSNDGVYIGGTFAQANGITANNIALYSSNTWSVLTDNGTGITGTGNEIRSIAIDENNVVYVGGNFASAGGNTASRIATWNGSNWGTLGAGTSGFVQAIEITPSYVYAGGNFALAGGIAVNRIARWNRSTNQWEKIENGLSNNVNDLSFRNGYLYVAGSFTAALNNAPTQNIIVNGLARWSALGGWEALGTTTNVGVDNLLNTLTFNNEELYIGGTFDAAGVRNVTNFTCWQEPCATIDLDIRFDGFPNQTSWEITDVDGNIVTSSGGTYSGQSGGSLLNLTPACLPDGCYDLTFYDLINNGMCPFRATASSSGTFITPGTLISSGSVVATLGTVVSPGLCGNYQLYDASGNTIVSGGGGFGASETNNFCISGGVAALAQANNNWNIEKRGDIAIDLQILPNLVGDKITVIYSLEEMTNTELYIIDINGKVLQQHTQNAIGTQEVRLNVSELASGFYFVKLVLSDIMMTQKFVKK